MAHADPRPITWVRPTRASGICRSPASPRAPLVDELAGVTGLAQLQIVVVDQLRGREAVVQLDEVEVLRVDAGDVVRLGRGLAGERVDIGLDLIGVRPRVGRHHRSGDLHGARALLGRQRPKTLLRHEHHRGRAVPGGAAHEQRVGVAHHLGVHDLVEAERLLVLRERVEGRVRVILLCDLRELLEADAVVLVRVLHSRLREHTRHQARAEHALNAHYRAVTPAGLEHLAVTPRLAGRAEQTLLAHLLHADCKTHVGLAGLDREVHGANRGRTGRARIGDVVDRDAGLPDLLLDALPHAGPRLGHV